jgi:hypothetical protein
VIIFRNPQQQHIHSSELKDNGVTADKIKFVDTHFYCVRIGNLTLKLYESVSHNCFYYTSKPECAIPEDNSNSITLRQCHQCMTVKLYENGGITQETAGVKIKIAIESGLQTNSSNDNGLPITSGFTLIKNTTQGLQIDLPDNSGLSLDPTGLKIAVNGIKGSNTDFVANRPVYNNVGANNQVDFRFNTNEFQLMEGTHPGLE